MLQLVTFISESQLLLGYGSQLLLRGSVGFLLNLQVLKCLVIFIGDVLKHLVEMSLVECLVLLCQAAALLAGVASSEADLL